MLMQRLTYALIAILGAGVWGANIARAEDIDVFSGTPGSGLPNVLFIVDNTANWNQAFTNEMAALYNTLTNPKMVNDDGSAKFNIGIMLATETGNPNNAVSGGYIRAAMRPLTSATATLYATMVNNFDKLGDKGNGGYSALQLAEAYYYFSGAAPYAGNGKAKTDFYGNYCTGCNLNSTQVSADNAVYALAGNALSGQYAAKYNAPATGSCGHYYIIYISNGANQDSNSVDTDATQKLTAAGGDATTIPISPSGSMSNPSDEWARFLYSSSLGVATYTIDVDPGTTGQGPGWTALLKSMSGVSNGKYAAVSSSTGSGQQIADALAADLSEMQAVNSVFASVSLPVSVNTQGTFLNRVFIGMFRPDPDAAPRWMGNLKQYKLGMISNSLLLEDAASNSAINSLTGFISECARSFWTPSGADTYWSKFGAEGLCISPNNTQSNSPDGNIVEKGGQGYLLRGGSSVASATSANRTVKTCSPTFSNCTSNGSSLSLDDFKPATSYITQSLLDPTNATSAATLIDWARGANNDSANSGDLEYATGYGIRPSVHGDVVHSRPVAINYGSDSSPQIVVFYGANDGELRAINGNRDGEGSINSVGPGAEIWSFMPPEFYGSIKRLYNNSPQIKIPAATVTGALPKNYSMDGPVTANTDNHVWIYAPMRRGGRALYAFDATTVSSIKLKWKVGCPINFPATGTVDDSNCSSGFSGIGQTWSSARIVKTAGSNTSVLIMGGGYDTCEDSDSNTCTSSTKGNKIYVIDADTGSLLQTFTTARAVSADIAVVPDLSSGLVIYAYAVDLGGNIYRISIGSSAPGSWGMTQIASLGCSAPGTCTANRKFMFAPDVVLQNGIYTVLLGSGDREKPLVYSTSGSVVNTVANDFFAVQDNPTSSTWLSSEAANCAGTAVLCLNSLYATTPSSSAPSAATLAGKKGWYMSLSSKEQVVTSAITIFGTVYFSSHQPTVSSAASCKVNLGNTRLYTVTLNLSSVTSTLLPPVGLPPSPVAGRVTLDDGQTVVFCIGCTAASPLQSSQPQAPAGTVPAQPKSRVYWYIQR
jgi:type IV pilus assembly protein PilY1